MKTLEGAYNSVYTCVNTWIVCQTRVYHSQIFDWKQSARHSFSLFGGIKLSRRTNKTSESTARLSLAQTMGDYWNSLIITSVTFCADVFPAHRRPSIKFFKSIVLIVKKRIEWASVIDQTFEFLWLTLRLIKWTVCKKWKRNDEKLQPLIKSFLMA